MNNQEIDYISKLNENNICKEANTWMEKYSSLEKAFNECERGDWLLTALRAIVHKNKKKWIIICETIIEKILNDMNIIENETVLRDKMFKLIHLVYSEKKEGIVGYFKNINKNIENGSFIYHTLMLMNENKINKKDIASYVMDALFFMTEYASDSSFYPAVYFIFYALMVVKSTDDQFKMDEQIKKETLLVQADIIRFFLTYNEIKKDIFI